MNSLLKFSWGLAALALCLATGCQTAAPTQVTDADTGYTRPSQPPAPALSQPAEPETVTPRASTPAPDATSNVILRTDQLEVTKTVLEPASVGGELKYRIRLEAREAVGAVGVTETIPNGVRFRSADPAAAVSGNQVSWRFPSMSAGQVQNIDITVEPTAEGDHRICSTVSVENAFCMDVFAGQPSLDVVKEGPSTVELGEEVTWTVTVTNNGSAAATNVVVEDSLPEAFTPTTNLRQPVGTLEPGQTRTVRYSAKAVKQGEFRNRAVATYAGSGPDGEGGSGTSAESGAPISVVQSGIRVRKTGPAEAYVFKPETFEITIENTGDTDLENVRITDILPEGTSVVDNGRGRVSGNAIGWMIPNLPAGASQLVTTQVAASQKGPASNTVKVVTGSGLEASDSISTDWLAVPGVTVSITDSKDPIRVGEATTYTVRVRNQGDFEPVSGTVIVEFNDHLRPTDTAGGSAGTIDGRSVTFPQATLEPGKDINLTINAEGAEIGPGRAVLRFTADFLADPIISEEATNVY